MTHRTFAGATVGESIDRGAVTVDREGIHTFALTQSPVVETFYGDSDVIAAGHIEALRFPTPVCPDDTLAVELERRNETVWAR